MMMQLASAARGAGRRGRVGLLALFAAPAAGQEARLGLGIEAVPAEQVVLREGFWREHVLRNARVSVAALLDECEGGGLVRNFRLAAGAAEGEREEGEHSGDAASDALVYVLLEAAALSLGAVPDARLEERTIAIVDAIAAAQRDDGYLHTWSQLAEAGRPWQDLADGCELYCTARLIEAGVALARATGRTRLLEVARRSADALAQHFGSQGARRARRPDPPGIPGIELALLELARHTGESRYASLAQDFVEARGHPARSRRYGEYAQDLQPLLETRQAGGHAARGIELYCAVADIARRTGYADFHRTALTLFDDVFRRRMHVIGAAGLAGRRFAFGDPHELPTDGPGPEAASAAAIARWSHLTFLLHRHPLHPSVMERALYNGVLGGISLDGREFYWTLPLSSDGSQRRAPGLEAGPGAAELCRAVASVGGRVFGRDKGNLYVATYAACSAALELDKGEVRVSVDTRYPLDGKVEIGFDSEWSQRFRLHVLIPEWCEEGVGLGVNEKIQVVTVEHGYDPGTYLVYDRLWKPGDTFLLELPLVPKRLRAPGEVAACRGRAALRRGPLVYAIEAVDHGGTLQNLYLPASAELRSEWRPELLGGVHVLTAAAIALVRREGRVVRTETQLTAIPYYATGNRGPTEMLLWIPESPEHCVPTDD